MRVSNDFKQIAEIAGITFWTITEPELIYPLHAPKVYASLEHTDPKAHATHTCSHMPYLSGGEVKAARTGAYLQNVRLSNGQWIQLKKTHALDNAYMLTGQFDLISAQMNSVNEALIDAYPTSDVISESTSNHGDVRISMTIDTFDGVGRQINLWQLQHLTAPQMASIEWMLHWSDESDILHTLAITDIKVDYDRNVIEVYGIDKTEDKGFVNETLVLDEATYADMRSLDYKNLTRALLCL